MNISAIKCTPIKPQVSFRSDESKFDAQALHDMASDLNEKAVDSKDIKKPLAIVASLAALAGIAYGGGKKVAAGANVIYEKVAAAAKPAVKEAADDVAEAARKANLGVVIEDGLKKASSIAANGISKLRTVPVGEVTVHASKKDMIRNTVADVLEKGLNVAKTAYKKVAYSGIPANADATAKAQAAFENVAGAIGLATVVPEIISRDADGDGVKDIVQKSQNAYTSTEDKVKNATENMGTVTNILQMLT